LHKASSHKESSSKSAVTQSSSDGTQSNSDMVFLPSAYKAVLQEAMLKQHSKHARLVKAFQSPMHYLMIRQSSWH